jgi:hypothetical protein
LTERNLDPDALLCALVLAPRTFSRNRFFQLFQKPEERRVRRRAARIRGMVRQLSGQGRRHAEITGEQVLADGRVLIRYAVGDLAFRRTSALTRLEAATMHFSLFKAGVIPRLDDEDRELVEAALAKLGEGVDAVG